jgi:hypothetical protein
MADRIREILLADWDPANASRFPAARKEYDPYLPALEDLINRGAPVDAIVEYLHQRELESMCFPGLDTRRLRPLALKLLALRDQTAS